MNEQILIVIKRGPFINYFFYEYLLSIIYFNLHYILKLIKLTTLVYLFFLILIWNLSNFSYNQHLVLYVPKKKKIQTILKKDNCFRIWNLTTDSTAFPCLLTINLVSAQSSMCFINSNGDHINLFHLPFNKSKNVKQRATLNPTTRCVSLQAIRAADL